jgi:hypothetical protein
MSLIEVEDPQAPVDIRLYMNGTAFKDGIPIYLLTHGFSSAQTLLDRAYLGLAGKARMTAEERSHFYLLTRGVKHSSLDGLMQLVLTNVQTTFPIIGALGPTGIWEYAKQAYELLKFVYEQVKKGNTPTIQHSGNGDVTVTSGGITNIYNGTVFQIADNSQRIYVDVAKQINRGGVDQFSLTDGRGTGLSLTTTEAAYFDTASVIDTTPIKIECEIFDFNKFEDTGKLRVIQPQELPANDYRFTVVGNQAEHGYIEAMLRKSVKVTCLREVTLDPLKGEKIVRLQVLSVGT